MPQKSQIVPKFQHPHVETYVNDYTQFKDEVSTPVDNNSKFIAVFRSGSGIDNVFVKKNNLNDFIKTYGASNYEKYGQPLMMPIAMLSSGNATVNCMRVMPDNAFAANCILNMYYKTDNDTGRMTIKYRASYIDKNDFSDPSFYKTQKMFKKQLKHHAQSLRNDDADTNEGFKVIPIATFRMNGRGTYGNGYRWRIAPNMSYEQDYNVKMYSFEVLSTANGLEKVASYTGSIVTSPKFSNSLTLINDIIDEEDMGDIIMDVQVLEENIEEVYNVFVNFVKNLDEDKVDKNGIPDIDEFDIFFGRRVGTTEQNTNIMIIGESQTGNPGTSSEDISVDRPQGTTLSGGDDGSFSLDSKYVTYVKNDEGESVSIEYTGQQAVYMAETDVYKQAFSGDFDRTILSTRRMPCVALLDANYSIEVKEVLADLANTRESTLLYLDCGLDVTTATINGAISELASFNTRNISKCIQHYTTKDPTTQKRCDVTMTYFLAQKLATHFRDEGSWVPFVKSRALLSGHIKNSLEPCIDDTDSDIKEVLYTNRINYFECTEENVYERATQSTAQMINSDLIEENNMYTLYTIKEIIEADCSDNLYNFTSSEARADFAEYEKAKFSGWEGTRLDSLDIEFDANEWEAERSIIHCYVSIKFRNIMKRAIVEIDVNKRNFTS